MSSSEISRIKERSKSRKQINEIYDNSIRTYLIHYSCESFYENSTGGSTRVTSIAIRNLKSAQTKSWSIHKSAELNGQLDSIQQNIDDLEKSMLDGYFTFLEAHRDHTFIHWNMRDENYGFAALEHRYRVLGGTPFELNDDKKVDLARELVTLYGRKYAPHTSPKGRKGRLMSIVEMNNIADIDALPGAEEADAFIKGEYLKLHQSTLRKMDILANIFDRIHDKSIKTNATFMDTYGIHPIAILELAKNNPLVTGLIFLSSIGIAIINYSKIFAWIKPLIG